MFKMIYTNTVPKCTLNKLFTDSQYDFFFNSEIYRGTEQGFSKQDRGVIVMFKETVFFILIRSCHLSIFYIAAVIQKYSPCKKKK